MSADSNTPRMLCSLHGEAFTHGCPGCERAEDWDIVRLVNERKATDTGERLTLEELAEELNLSDELGGF